MGHSGAACGMDTAVQTKTLPLPQQIQRFSALVAQLNTTRNNFHDRLIPVRTMAPSAPSDLSPKPPAAPQPSNLAAQLALINNELEEQIRRFEQMRGELDV